MCLTGMMLTAFSCQNKTEKGANESAADTIVVGEKDSTIYGICGEGTMMHTLELQGDDGKSITVTIDEEMGSDVQGGLFAGDRMAVTVTNTEDGPVAQKVINLTTLMGKWTSLDRNFVIKEDGSIESNVTAETKPYTAWSVANARLVLNVDTFDVVTLSADSLELENANGIYVYKRQK